MTVQALELYTLCCMQRKFCGLHVHTGVFHADLIHMPIPCVQSHLGTGTSQQRIPDALVMTFADVRWHFD